MKHLKIKLKMMSLAVALAFAYVPAHAQFTSDYFYLGLSGGYSTLLGSVKEMTVLGYAGAGFHFGYEFRTSHFLMRAGADLQYFSSRCNTNLVMPDAHISDTRSGDAVMHYTMRTPLQETQQFALPGLILQAGYSTNDYKQSKLNGGFYVLGGVKVWFKHDIKNEVTLGYTTTATYTRYIDDYEDMPNHFYKDYDAQKDVSYGENHGLKISAVVSAELGWEYNFRSYDNMKIGAFVDMGVNSIMTDLTTQDCSVNRENAAEIDIYSYYNSTAMKDKWVVPLMAGVKLIYSFNLNRKRNCHSKDCNVGYRQRR